MSQEGEPASPLGELIVARGLCDRATIDRAVERQREAQRAGNFRRLGEVLIELGALSKEQLQDVLAAQGKTILVCPVCRGQYNVDHHEPGRDVLCSRCSVPLVRPDKLEKVQVEDELGGAAPRPAPVAAPPAATAVLAGASALQAETGLLARLRPATSGRFGPYEILGEISRGGMGVVYKARQTGLGRVVALKVIIAGQASSEAVERFRREARALSSLRHPNIVGVHEVGEIEGVNYFSMDFIEGLTIDHAVTQEMLSPRDVAEIFVKICEAAGYAHSKGVVHRDLKPRNIILDKRREPVLIDFGIARVTEIEREAGALTRKDEVLGSPAYLAPEYLSGAVPRYDEACDVYSLGACLYHALSGRSPHADVDTIKIILSASTRDAPHIRQFARSIDRDLATIVMTAVDRQRQHRYRSARDMAHDLRRYLDGETVAARATPVVRWWRRVRLKVAATLGLILSFALVGMSGYYASKFRALEKTEATTGVAEVALRRRMVELAMKLAEAQLAGGHAQDAEHTATEAIALAAGPNLAPAYCLRAKVRRALGHAEQADEDDKLAATAPTK